MAIHQKLKAIRQQWKELLEAYRDPSQHQGGYEQQMYAAYGYIVLSYDKDTGNPKRTWNHPPRLLVPFIFWLQNKFSLMWCLYMIAFCELFGHKLVDEGYAGPESGCIDICCERCGRCLHHQQLY